MKIIRMGENHSSEDKSYETEAMVTYLSLTRHTNTTQSLPSVLKEGTFFKLIYVHIHA